MTITEERPVETVEKTAIDVAGEALEFIKANPDAWNQATWSACFAYHFARLSPGVEVEVDVVASCGCCSTGETGVRLPDGQTVSVGTWFHRQLGDGAWIMTNMERKIDELEAGVGALRAGGSVDDAMRAARLRRVLP